MKKVLYTLLALIIAGGAYIFTFSSSGGLFPDTSEFGRMPKGEGTIGYVLDLLCPNFISGCRAPDTEKLGGIPANQYIKIKNCESPGTVWRSIDQFGNPECRDKTAQLALWQATVSEFAGTMRIIHPNNSITVVNNTELTRVVKEGDIIQTSANSSGTITFSDASVLRLDADTTVELSTSSNSAGESIAAIILADGQLWGRVLTSSGMDFGAGGYIAGVRGTSIMVSKPKNNPTVTIAIIDSTHNGATADTAAASIKNTNPGADQNPIYLDAGSKVIESSGAIIPPTEEPNITKELLLAQNEWARKNTIEDIEYLAETLGATTTTETIKEAIEQEITAVLPPDIGIPEGLFPNDTDKSEIDEDSADDEGESPAQKTKNTAKRIECKKENPNTRYWKSTKKCEDEKLIAFASFTGGMDGALYLKKESKKNKGNGTPSNDGIKITGSNYIQYELTENELGRLAGKTVEIELNSKIGTPSGTYKTLFSFSSTSGIRMTSNGWYCSWGTSVNFTPCGNTITEEREGNFIKVTLPSSFNITTWRIGNNSNLTYHLESEIRSIKIKNP